MDRKKLDVSRALRRQPALAKLARLCRARRAAAWIVGGAPRDGLLGRSALDVDVAVSGDAERLARSLAESGFGSAVPISEADPRVFRVAGRIGVDLVELDGGTIEEDLRRRDFTVNAMAIELSTGRWIDPFEGAADLARRRLRLVRVENLAEDPLRALRAARLIATHGLLPEAGVLKACRAVAPELARVAPERIQAELSRMLEATRVSGAFRWAAKAGLLPPALSVKDSPRGFAAASRALARLEASRRRLPLPRLRTVRLASIAGGLGLSPSEAARWLRERRHARAEAGEVANLLTLSRQGLQARSLSRRWAWVHDAGAWAPEALLLLEAGHPGRQGLVKGLRRLVARRRRGPAVSGSDVVAWLGVTPGPVVGRLLREARIEILRGRLRKRTEVRAWLLARRDQRGTEFRIS